MPTSSHPAPLRLGEWLVAHGIISQSQCDTALRLQARTHSRLGTVLTHCIGLCPRRLAQALAAQTGATMAATELEHASFPLLNNADHEDYLRYQLLPYQLNEAGELTALAPAPTHAGERWLLEHFPQARSIRWCYCTARDFQHVLARHFGAQLTQKAADRVFSQSPRMSARTTLLALQTYSALFWLMLVVSALILLPSIVFWSIWFGVQLIAVAGLLFKLGMIVSAMGYRPQLARLPGWEDAPWRHMPEADLPVYSVLIPLYKETAMIPHLLTRLQQLDYPRDKLDIKCLVEADDTATWDALKAARPERCIEIIAVPPGNPRTKPKACNYALPYLRGSLVTIYDAEDAPEPDQLRMSAWAFSQLPSEVACLQARLNFYNRDQRLITRWFALEYALWFQMVLPGLERGGFPIPLGGTSNHFRRFALEQTGGWDAYNVTEDADLGIRLRRFRWKTLLLPSHTWEEAPHTVWDWMMQRTRWIKGYMQTWCVHLRTPPAELWRLGWRHVVGFHLFIGAPCLLYLTLPLLLGTSLASLMWKGISPPIASSMGWFAVLLAFLLHALVAPVVLRQLPGIPAALAPNAGHASAMRSLLWATLSFPLYWLLHSCAALRALWQLIRRPHYWDKTSHGHSISRQSLGILGKNPTKG
jgi:cellulose synthase/poly-beta-1,6-N-acetylglucosamine synthase-like glycosyltransferase